jgi:hypothetical protein
MIETGDFGKDEGVGVEAEQELVVAKYDCCLGSAMRLAGIEDGKSDLANRSRHRLRSC